MDSKTKKKLQTMLKEFSKYFDDKQSLDAVSHLKTQLDTIEIEEKKEADIVGDIFIYTDGACRGNPGPGAYGYLVQDSKKNDILEGSEFFELTTNNKMELQGVIEGLNALNDIQSLINNKSLIVVTDSKYVVDGITKWVPGWKNRGWKKADKKPPENLELWQNLDRLNMQFSPKYQWVKGHAGHEQNEYVDQLANKALDEAGF